MQASPLMTDGYEATHGSASGLTRGTPPRLRLTATALSIGIGRWLKQIAACVLVCLVVGQMAACRGTSKNLSRSDALTKIQASPDKITGPIAAQTYVPCAQRAEYEHNNTELLRTWDHLVAEGVAELRDSVVSPPSTGSGAIVNCIFRLTSAGRNQVGASWVQHDIGLAHFEYIVPFGERYATEVTGVSQTGDAKEGSAQGEGSEARVEFRWAMRPTSSTDLLKPPNEKFPAYRGPGVAIFRRYDDGWRLMGTSYGPDDHS